MNDLWCEKYRPTTLNDYVFRDDHQKQQVEAWVAQGSIPHLIFSGGSGIGKSTLAKVLCNELQVNDLDVLEINASRTNSVEDVRDKIVNFVQMIPFGDFKVVLLDECDFLSVNAQAALRGVMEEYHTTSRFILTCVTGDTLVYTDKGTKQIKDVVAGDMIRSGKSFIRNMATVVSKSSDIYKLTTTHGDTLTATGNHEVLTLDGGMRVDRLKIGTKLLVNLTDRIGLNYDASKFENTNAFNIDEFNEYRRTTEVHTLAPIVYTPARLKINEWILARNKSKIITSVIVEDLGMPLSHIVEYLHSLPGNVLVSHSLRFIYINLAKFLEIVNPPVEPSNDEQPITISTNFTKEQIASLGRLAGACTLTKGSDEVAFFVKADSVYRAIYDDIQAVVGVPESVGYTKAFYPKYPNLTVKSKMLRMLMVYGGAAEHNDKSCTYFKSPMLDNNWYCKHYIQGWFSGKSAFMPASFRLVYKTITKSTVEVEFVQYLSRRLKELSDIDTTVFVTIDDKVSAYNVLTWAVADIVNTSKFFDVVGISHIGDTYDGLLIGWIRFMIANPEVKLTFKQWRKSFMPIRGYVVDTIKSVEKLEVTEPIDVYDCSFENIHWYYTNGITSHNCNYPNRVIPALHSRCQGFHVETVDTNEFTARIATILINENVQFDLDTLDTYVKATYPDLRKCINSVQMNSMNGMLHKPEISDSGSADYKIKMVELFKQGKIADARKLLCAQARPEEMEDIYRWLYTNIDLLGKTEDQKDQAILIIKQALVDHTICADSEINLAACLIRLARIK